MVASHCPDRLPGMSDTDQCCEDRSNPHVGRRAAAEHVSGDDAPAAVAVRRCSPGLVTKGSRGQPRDLCARAGCSAP